MKIKYRFISETTEIKASDDWGDLFFEFVHQGYNMDHRPAFLPPQDGVERLAQAEPVPGPEPHFRVGPFRVPGQL